MKKKIMFLVLIVCLFVLCTEPVFAANIASCKNSMGDALIDEKIPNIVSTVINVIKIVVPVLLVIFGMLDLMKGITAGKEDEMKKGQQLFIKRLISGALVFFVFAIVQLLVSFVADDEDEPDIATCSKCFLNGDCTYLPDEDGCKTGTKLNKEGICVKTDK